MHVSDGIFMAIINMLISHHHHHVMLLAHISLILSRHLSLSSIAPSWSSRLHPVSAQLLYIGSSWSFCLCSSMWRGPLEYIAYEFVLTSPAVSRMSGSLCNCNQAFSPIRLVSVHIVHPYSSINTTADWKKSAFYFIGQVWHPYNRLPIESCLCICLSRVVIFGWWDAASKVGEFIH